MALTTSFITSTLCLAGAQGEGHPGIPEEQCLPSP